MYLHTSLIDVDKISEEIVSISKKNCWEMSLEFCVNLGLSKRAFEPSISALYFSGYLEVYICQSLPFSSVLPQVSIGRKKPVEMANHIFD